jgi:YHS domain-containing protein
MPERQEIPQGGRRNMATVIDPMCGMQLDEQQSAITSQYMNRTYYFCSLGCKRQFDVDPQRYAIKPAQRTTPDDQALADPTPSPDAND